MKKIIVILLSVSLFSCHHKKMTDSAKTETKATAPEEVKEIIPQVTVDATADMVNTGARYTVDSIALNSNMLSVFVKYSGGCKEHTWDLKSNGMYAKSLPPQISVCLTHTNNGDACRELIIKEIKFDIAKLKHPNNKTVVVKLGDKQVTYTF